MVDHERIEEIDSQDQDGTEGSPGNADQDYDRMGSEEELQGDSSNEEQEEASEEIVKAEEEIEIREEGEGEEYDDYKEYGEEEGDYYENDQQQRLFNNTGHSFGETPSGQQQRSSNRIA